MWNFIKCFLEIQIDYISEEGSHGTTVSGTAQNGAHHARHQGWGQVQLVKYFNYKYKYFELSPIKYTSTSSTDTPSTSTSTSVNIGWLICTGNTRAVFPGKYRPVQ